MSSVVAFLRALLMLAFLLAVPALAVSHGGAVSRGLQAMARFLDRVSAAPEAETPVTSEALRSARPAPRMPVKNGAAATDAGEDDSLRLLPEPLEERGATVRATPIVGGRSASAGESSAEPAESQSRGTHAVQHHPQMTAWQEAAVALQQLGAVEYALEKWGASGELYRFRCLAAVPGAASYQRHFQAVDADGGRAVEQVVQQVRVWRADASGVPRR